MDWPFIKVSLYSLSGTLSRTIPAPMTDLPPLFMAMRMPIHTSMLPEKSINFTAPLHTPLRRVDSFQVHVKSSIARILGAPDKVPAGSVAPIASREHLFRLNVTAHSRCNMDDMGERCNICRRLQLLRNRI